MRKILLPSLILLTFFISCSKPANNLNEKYIEYEADGIKMKGYLVYSAKIKNKRPGILVVHEWWGLNEYVKKRARMLAELGYTAFALDMYGADKRAKHPKTAKKFSMEVISNIPSAKKRFLKALEILTTHKTVDKNNIAAIGYCFGGGVVLNMARMGVNLKGVVSFHGSLVAVKKAQSGMVKAKILVLNGAADPLIKPEQIQAFKKEMENAAVDYTFINYEGAKHAFTNPDATETGKKFKIPVAYNEKADKQSWKKMNSFLQEIFSK